MSNSNNPSLNKDLAEKPLDPADAGAGRVHDSETLFDYLCRTGKAAFREVPLFAGWQRPKRPKPTFTWPRVPTLF